MQYVVRNASGQQVGDKFTDLQEAQNLVAANDGYTKGWYVEPLKEGYNGQALDTGPQFLAG